MAARATPRDPMKGIGLAPTAPGCLAPLGRCNRVLPAFWPVAIALLLATLLGAPMGQSMAVTAATVLFLGGGLPHGAYDIALLRRAVAPGRGVLVLVIGGYVAIAVAMALLWMTLPLLALVLFLSIAAVHFGEDWQMLEEPLLRIAAGAAVITVPTISHPTEVAALFAAMSDDRSTLLVRIISAAAPMTLLVTAVGIAAAWLNGSRTWAAAMTLCLVVLLVVPPVIGFALFFVLLHSPLHLDRANSVLREMSRPRWIATGGLLSGATILGWMALQVLFPFRINANFTSQAFQLLAAVAVPHLLLSHWLERRVHAAAGR
ncbi:Brp/Blh family beta-carotene 15,15'-dioxygenase [Caulobacter sp. DWR2-3-1b2]|uniref:Brp/Blh family beta-carotene 15,15'-dioxygenase n=1 Tax=unclassified Caulobacter TaxID=2648921 RepID=UPI003CE9FC96